VAPHRQGSLGWKRRALFLAVVWLVSIPAAEGLLRLYVALRGWTPNCYAAQLELLAPHPVSGYRLAPDFRLRSGTFRIATNSLGLRGPEIDVDKPPGTVRIAIFGGSAAFGYLVSDGQEAARLLERRLGGEAAGVQVINAGVPGYNLFHSFDFYEETVARLDPDVVVLYAGCNDIGYVVSPTPDAERFRRAGRPRGWERCLGHSTLYGFVAYRLSGATTRLDVGHQIENLPTRAGLEQFRRNLNAFTDAVEQSGGVLVLCAEATAARADVAPDLRTCMGSSESEIERTIAIFEALRATFREFAVQEQLPYLDASAEVPPDREHLGDTIHLTPAGEARLADYLAKELRPLIEARRATPAH
jgi:lysophospholipase L1-like esterase